MSNSSISYKFVSGDGHVTEPGNLWLERMDARFRDRAPRLVSGPDLCSQYKNKHIPGGETISAHVSLDARGSDFFVIDKAYAGRLHRYDRHDGKRESR